MMPTMALLGLSLLGALSASADESLSLLQTAAHVEDAQLHAFGGIALATTVSDADIEDVATIKLLIANLTTMKKELDIEREMRRALPAEVNEGKPRISMQDSASCLTLINKLNAKLQGRQSAGKVSAAAVQKLMNKVATVLYGDSFQSATSHWNTLRGFCYQGPADHLRRMMYLWRNHDVYESFAGPEPVAPGPCSEPYTKPGEKDGCYPFAEVFMIKDWSHDNKNPEYFSITPEELHMIRQRPNADFAKQFEAVCMTYI